MRKRKRWGGGERTQKKEGEKEREKREKDLEGNRERERERRASPFPGSSQCHPTHVPRHLSIKYLDGLDQVGGAVGHLLGRLDKLALGHWVGGAR